MSHRFSRDFARGLQDPNHDRNSQFYATYVNMGSRNGSKGPGGSPRGTDMDSKMADQMPRTAALPGQTAPEIETLYQLLLLSDIDSEPAKSAPAAATKKRKKSKHGYVLSFAANDRGLPLLFIFGQTTGQTRLTTVDTPKYASPTSESVR